MWHPVCVSMCAYVYVPLLFCLILYSIIARIHCRMLFAQTIASAAAAAAAAA